MSINDKLNRIKEIKGNIKDAIVEKGVEVTDSDSFNSYADKIRAISGGGGGTPVIPKPEVEEWVKPEGWPDIKEGIQDNQIRMLICDMAGRDNFGLRMEGATYNNCDCTIDWGDGSEPEIITSSRVTHKFNKDNSVKYTDEDGITHNMYIVTVDCRNIRYIKCDDDGISTRMLFWYVDSFKNDYDNNVEIDFYKHTYLQSVECLGEKVREHRPYLYECINLRNFKYNGTFKIVENVDNMFYNCNSLVSLDTSNWDTSSVTSMRGAFSNCNSLVSLDTSNWDTSSVTDMTSMFEYCNSLVSLDTSNWDTSNVTDMKNMFVYCKSLVSLDTSNWDTSSVTNMTSMFSACYSLSSLDVSNWDTSKVTDMTTMFKDCSHLTSLDVSNWDTSKVTDMTSMFNSCSHLISLDVSNWDTSKVTKITYIFQACNNLISLDVSNWDTSKVTDMTGIFDGCSRINSLDVSNWDTSKVTDMSNMLSTCQNLKDIKPIKWDFSLFAGSGYSSKCKSIFKYSRIERLDLTLQNSSDVTSSSYAPIDTTSPMHMRYYYDFSLTIPRPTFKLKIVMGNNMYINYNLQRLIIKGQDVMTFTAASPQIALDYTYAFKEEQINEFFTNLPTVTNSPTISLKNNPHAGYANMGIALEKGWNVLYDSSTNSTSTIPLDDEGQPTNLPLVYRFIPEEDGTFVDANGNKCNLLYSQSVATMNPTGWEMLPTFEDALNKYGIEVEEEYREEIAKDVLAYANDDSLIKRYNIELD